jgi:branched-chain amino acid transport system permease protein
MNLVAPTIVAGLSTGMVYALVATGMLLVFNATAAVNLAHGDLITVGMYIVVVGLIHAGMPWWICTAGAVLGGSAVGVIMEQVAYRPFLGRGQGEHGHLLLIFITTLALSQAVEGGLSLVTTTQGTGAPPVFATVTYHVGPFAITPQQIVLFGVAGVSITVIALGMRYLQIGRVMRAVSQHANAASLLGANPRRIALIAWGLSGAAAGIAGALLAPGTIITPYSGGAYLFIAFAAAVLGGFGSIGGAVLGALILALAQAFFATYISVVWSPIVPFIILILVLVIRPSGLFGVSEGRV